MTDRTTKVRDAVLVWLFKNTEEGRSHPVLKADAIAAAVDWKGDPPSQPEIDRASRWLAEEGHLKGTGMMGGGIPRPSITNQGDRLVRSGRSVADDPSAPVPSSFIIVQNSTGVAIANNSSDVTQTVDTDVRIEKVQQVASALEAAAQQADVAQPVAEEARETARELREEAGSSAPNWGKLKELLFKAATAVAGGLGAELGTSVAQQSFEALGVLT